MAPVRTTIREETPDNIEYGAAILVAFKLQAERQLEVIAPDQQGNLLVLCRSMQDIQAAQGYLYVDDEAPDLNKGRHAKEHND
jgi:hypothetical protein